MSAPVPMFGTQDLNDDDGPVIDSFLVETDAAPDIKDAIEPIPIPAPIKLPTPTRLLAGTELITVDRGVYQLLPADANRTELQILVSVPFGTATATDYLNVSGELGPASFAKTTDSGVNGVFRVRAGSAWDVDTYTGPVYISGSNGQTQTLEVSWRAISS